MAENFKPSTAQEFVGENNELPTRDELLSMFTKKQKDLAEKLAETEAKPGFKLDANEMMAKRRSEKQLKTQLDSVNEEWKRLGGDKIDEAQAAVDALDFKSDASDHVKAKSALRDAKEAFYSNFSQEFSSDAGDNNDVDVDPDADPDELTTINYEPSELFAVDNNSDPLVRNVHSKNQTEGRSDDVETDADEPAAASGEANGVYIIDNDADSTSTEEAEALRGRKILGELTLEQKNEMQSKLNISDFVRYSNHRPYNMADIGEDWDNYEADDTSKKDKFTDAEVYQARELVDSGKNENVVAAYKIYMQLLKKARKSVEAEYYDEDDYKQAANALAIEIFGKTEDEVRQAMQAVENKKNAAEGQSEADAADTAGAATDADTDAAIKERFEAMEKDELEIPEEYEATFKKTLEKQEAENKPGRIKRLLGRIGLKRTGIKRPGLISRIKQDSEYRNWLRERKGQAKPSLDGKVEVESGSQTETTDMNEFFETEISELNRRKPSGADREHMSDLIVQAKVLYNTNQRDKAKYLYQAVREHLSKLDAKSNNLWGSDVFDDNFRADLDRLGKKFEDAAE